MRAESQFLTNSICCELPNPAFARTPFRVLSPPAAAARRPLGVGAWSGVRSVCGSGGAADGSAAAEPCVAVREEVSGGGEATAPRLETPPAFESQLRPAGGERGPAGCAALRGTCAHNGRRRTGTVRDAAVEQHCRSEWRGSVFRTEREDAPVCCEFKFHWDEHGMYFLHQSPRSLHIWMKEKSVFTPWRFFSSSCG